VSRSDSILVALIGPTNRVSPGDLSKGLHCFPADRSAMIKHWATGLKLGTTADAPWTSDKPVVILVPDSKAQHARPKAGLTRYLSLVYSCRGNQEDGSGRCWCRPTVLLVLIKSPIHLRLALDLFDRTCAGAVWSVCPPSRPTFMPFAVAAGGFCKGQTQWDQASGSLRYLETCLEGSRAFCHYCGREIVKDQDHVRREMERVSDIKSLVHLEWSSGVPFLLAVRIHFCMISDSR
jgi:hypothetical protein